MNRKIKGFTISCSLVLIALSYPILANSQQTQPGASICPLISGKNLLSNSNFQTVGLNGSSTSFTGTIAGGNSSADKWTVYNNKSATTKTELVTSTFPGSEPRMIHVTTTGSDNGLVQVYPQLTSIPKRAIAATWVFVKNGQVGIGVGTGGNTSVASNTISSTINKWERLQTQNLSSPVSEFIIYSSRGPADFYIANACVTEVP